MKQEFSFKQELRPSQTTVLAPQLQQGVQMLQLSSLELQNQLEKALDSNPFLERLEIDADFAVPHEADSRPGESRADRSEKRASNAGILHGSASQASFFSKANMGTAAGPRTDLPAREASDPLMEAADQPGLQGYLRRQAMATPLSDKQHFILEMLIDAVNDRGYLRATEDDIVRLAMPDYVVTRADVSQGISVLQGFEPVGVGARSSSECLLLQLADYSPETPGLELAKRVVSRHLLSLARKEFSQISADLETSEESLRIAIALIRQLNPFPGQLISSFREEILVPDLIVKKLNDRWVVRLNPNVSPGLSIHQESAELLKLAQGQRGYKKLLQTLQDARVLISNIENRYRTILRVATLIVERQQDFLERGDAGLQPLTRKELADTLEIHVSTVSRAVSDKYVLTPSGTVELGTFFSSAVRRSGGGSISSKAIQVQIRELIENEAKEKPLSDNQIAEILQERGIQVARRTVMKYREQLGIPASPKRRARKTV